MHNNRSMYKKALLEGNYRHALSQRYQVAENIKTIRFLFDAVNLLVILLQCKFIHVMRATAPCHCIDFGILVFIFWRQIEGLINLKENSAPRWSIDISLLSNFFEKTFGWDNVKPPVENHWVLPLEYEYRIYFSLFYANFSWRRPHVSSWQSVSSSFLWICMSCHSFRPKIHT